jgi:ABC-type uncharacterized transport system involved in gliding motility auxiliary subunit
MKITRQSRRNLRIHNIIFVVLLLAVVGLLAWLSTRYDYQADWTANGRNTLSAASVAVLDKFPEAITVTAFASESEMLRRHIRELVDRYQRRKSDLSLKFVNPDLEPQRVRELGLSADGEMLVEYQGRSEQVQDLSERGLSNALQRLLRGGERRVIFIQGHGERSPEGKAGYDLAQWVTQMKSRGIKVATVNLLSDAGVPDGTSVLVIASPRADYLPPEVDMIKDYVAGGGRLLWLADPGEHHGLDPLARSLGLVFRPGMIMDPNISRVGMMLFGTDDPRIALVTSYPAHAPVDGFAFNTLFPMSQSVTRVDRDSPWQTTAFLKTLSNTWQETGQQTGQITFDDSDIAGPLSLGLALSRSPPGDKPVSASGDDQRLVVIGDGDFLSNAFLGLGGNLQLAMNIINWLGSDDQLVDVPVRTAMDGTLELDSTAVMLIGGGFLLVLPLGLLGSGLLIWWRRRRF